MQVTHIPDPGVIESSVRFFVKVAAEAFILENVFVIGLSSIIGPRNFTCNTGLHVTHHIIKLFFFNTGRTKIATTATNRLFGFSVSAPQLAHRTYKHATAAQTTNI